MSTAAKTDVLRLADFVRALNGFEIRPRKGPCYTHMGATICDTILQAGLNYRTVVAPRVARVMQRWPSAWVTTRFLAMVSRYGLNDVLIWNHGEKLTRIGQLTEFLAARGIETERELSEWLVVEANGELLRELRGVGPKTVDYLKSLVGIPAVAVDRHIRTFVGWAGIQASSYNEIRRLVSDAAAILTVDGHALDHAIWSYVVSRRGDRRSA